MALKQASPANWRAKGMSHAHFLFNQIIVEKSDHCEMLLQSCIRQRGSGLSFSLRTP
jgi:hypothetical protein